MPIDVSVLVVQQEEPTPPLSVTFPCGGEVASLPQIPFPDGMAMAKSLLATANAAMAPLNPIFKVIDLALLIVEAFKAVPEMVTNPAKLIALLEKVVQAASALTKIIPPLSVPLLALGMIDLLIAFFTGLVVTLRQLVHFVERIEAATAEIPRYPHLQFVVDTSNENLKVTMRSLESGMTPIAKVMRLTNLLLQLAGLPPLPDVAHLPDNPREAIEPVEDMLRTLRAVRGMIPV